MMDESIQRRLVDEALADGVQRFVVGALVRREIDGVRRLLVLRRAADDFMGGIEELPSGKVDPGESLEEALVRELEEETSLRAEGALTYLFSFDYVSGSGRRTRQFNFAVVVRDEPVAVNPAEHSGHRWLSPPEYAGSGLTSNVVDLLRSTEA